MSDSPESAQVFRLERGSAPLLISLPHVGTRVPQALRAGFAASAQGLDDTDWFLDELYDFHRELGAGRIVPLLSRYVIDLNRPPHDEAMYPGANNTELCPTRAFDGRPIYREGFAPDGAERARRRGAYWEPYHAALRAELDRLRAAHGYALLLDGHSIRSLLPWLFEGRLPDLNLGTAGATSCSAALRADLVQVLERAEGFTHAVDGRFKGGFITRHYGQPDLGVQAVQLEMCWSCYMDERPPFRVDPPRAARLRPVLRALAEAMLAWRPAP